MFLFAGFALLSKSWHVLYHAQRRHQLAQAITGMFAILSTSGLWPSCSAFLLQWPTLLTLAMFPVLVLMYVRLAISEERDSEKAFGQAWRDYAEVTPRFIPRRGRRNGTRAAHTH